MFCKNCGKELKDGALFCEECGTYTESGAAKAQPVIVQQGAVTEETLPAQYRPLSPWAYFGLSLLFSIPIVGFIFLIIFSCSRANINRRNFARSYWCALIIVVAVVLILMILSWMGVIGSAAAEWIKNLFQK